MSDNKEFNCEELAKKMNDCLEKGDDKQCKEFVEEFNSSCKKEEKSGILSWVFGDKKEEEKVEEEKVEEDDKKED